MKNKLLIWVYSIRPFIFFVLCSITFNIQAQIIYTDIEPDFIGENLEDHYDLDLNNDQIVDYSLFSGTNEMWNYFVIVRFAETNEVIAISPSYTYAVSLESNKEIFNLSGYINGEYYDYFGLISLETCEGTECFYDQDYDWKDKNDKYVGLRFLINGQTHYGWVRLDVSNHSQWIIKDYAYNSSPNTPILAGQKVLGVENPDFNKVKVVVQKGIVSVFNLTDAMVYNLYAINGQKLAHGRLDLNNNSIEVQNLASGLYVIALTASTSSMVTTKKLVIP